MSTIAEILSEARKLPLDEQRQLASALLAETALRNTEDEDVRAAWLLLKRQTGRLKDWIVKPSSGWPKSRS